MHRFYHVFDWTGVFLGYVLLVLQALLALILHHHKHLRSIGATIAVETLLLAASD